MSSFDIWFANQGPKIAAAIDAQRTSLCDAVAQRLAEAFPRLCFDPARLDARSFQLKAYRNTPLRFHRTLQVVLTFQSPDVLAREYRWAWSILPRYGVEQYHLLSHVRWYFETVHEFVPIDPGDEAPLKELEAVILHKVAESTSDRRVPSYLDAGRAYRNGHGRIPGRE
jgi:hypothetical protein